MTVCAGAYQPHLTPNTEQGHGGRHAQGDAPPSLEELDPPPARDGRGVEDPARRGRGRGRDAAGRRTLPGDAEDPRAWRDARRRVRRRGKCGASPSVPAKGERVHGDVEAIATGRRRPLAGRRESARERGDGVARGRTMTATSRAAGQRSRGSTRRTRAPSPSSSTPCRAVGGLPRLVRANGGAAGASRSPPPSPPGEGGAGVDATTRRRRRVEGLLPGRCVRGDRRAGVDRVPDARGARCGGGGGGGSVGPGRAGRGARRETQSLKIARSSSARGVFPPPSPAVGRVGAWIPGAEDAGGGEARGGARAAGAAGPAGAADPGPRSHRRGDGGGGRVKFFSIPVNGGRREPRQRRERSANHRPGRKTKRLRRILSFSFSHVRRHKSRFVNTFVTL